MIWSPDQEAEHIWRNFNSKSKFFSKPWAEWLARASESQADRAKVNRVLHPRELELYRIDQDPYEVNDLANTPENKEKVDTLFTRLKEVMVEAGETVEPNVHR